MNYVLRRLSLILFIAPFLSAQAAPQSPEEVFGFRPGDDYKLASYEQMETYYRQLAAESDRVLRVYTSLRARRGLALAPSIEH